MSGTYYNLPAIPCENRVGAFTTTSSTDACNELNPDKIYNSLFPCSKTPLTAYNENKNKQVSGSSIDSLNNESPSSCATACNNNNRCKAFSIQNEPNTCELYKATDYVNSERYEVESINNKIGVYQYNKDNSNQGQECGEGCIVDAMQSFTKAEPPRAPKAWDTNKAPLKSTSKVGLSLDECKRECINEKDCNSIIYTEKENSCNLYNNSSQMTSNTKYNTYVKDPSKCNNNLGFDIQNTKKYKNYYKGYKQGGDDYSGKIGDYFCKYNTETNQCMTVSQLECNANSPQCSGQGTSKGSNMNNSPSGPSGPSPCLPPLCNPNTGQHLKPKNKGIRINDKVFESCQENAEDGFCLDDIYTFDDLGLPVSQYGPNPPSQNYLYMKDYDVKGGFTILNCPKNFTPVDAVYHEQISPTNLQNEFNGEYLCKGGMKGDDNILCVPVGQPKNKQYGNCPVPKDMIDVKKAFKTKNECISWCKNNPNCVGMTSSYDSKGNLLCNFYKKTPTGPQVKMMGSQIYTKRSDPYVYNPKRSNLKKFKIPNAIGINGSTTYDINEYCGKYGCCADGITRATDSDGSNCIEFSPDSNLIGSPMEYLEFTSLGGTVETVPIDTTSGSSYINYTNDIEQFTNIDNSNNNQYIMRYVSIVFFILVVILLISRIRF